MNTTTTNLTSRRRRRRTFFAGLALTAAGIAAGGGSSAGAIPPRVTCPNVKCAMAYIKACDKAGGTYDNDGLTVWCVR